MLIRVNREIRNNITPIVLVRIRVNVYRGDMINTSLERFLICLAMATPILGFLYWASQLEGMQ